MPVNRLLSLLLLVSLLPACAPGPPRWRWVHPRFEEAELRRDQQQCRKQAALEIASPFASPGPGQEYFEEKQDLIRRCLEGRGWRWEYVEEQ